MDVDLYSENEDVILGIPVGNYPIIVTPIVVNPFCPEIDGEIILNVNGYDPGHYYSYLWSDGSTSRNLIDIGAGTYNVTVSDAYLDSTERSIDVVYENGVDNACLIIHSAFSPNGDFRNDTWNIGNIHLYPLMTVIIYNQWGQLVWGESESGYPIPWDGKDNNGDVLPVDGYHSVINLHNGSDPILNAVTIVTTTV